MLRIWRSPLPTRLHPQSAGGTAAATAAATATAVLAASTAAAASARRWSTHAAAAAIAHRAPRAPLLRWVHPRQPTTHQRTLSAAAATATGRTRGRKRSSTAAPSEPPSSSSAVDAAGSEVPSFVAAEAGVYSRASRAATNAADDDEDGGGGVEEGEQEQQQDIVATVAALVRDCPVAPMRHQALPIVSLREVLRPLALARSLREHTGALDMPPPAPTAAGDAAASSSASSSDSAGAADPPLSLWQQHARSMLAWRMRHFFDDVEVSRTREAKIMPFVRRSGTGGGRSSASGSLAGGGALAAAEFARNDVLEACRAELRQLGLHRLLSKLERGVAMQRRYDFAMWHLGGNMRLMTGGGGAGGGGAGSTAAAAAGDKSTSKAKKRSGKLSKREAAIAAQSLVRRDRVVQQRSLADADVPMPPNGRAWTVEEKEAEVQWALSFHSKGRDSLASTSSSSSSSSTAAADEVDAEATAADANAEEEAAEETKQSSTPTPSRGGSFRPVFPQRNELPSPWILWTLDDWLELIDAEVAAENGLYERLRLQRERSASSADGSSGEEEGGGGDGGSEPLPPLPELAEVIVHTNKRIGGRQKKGRNEIHWRMPPRTDTTPPPPFELRRAIEHQARFDEIRLRFNPKGIPLRHAPTTATTTADTDDAAPEGAPQPQQPRVSLWALYTGANVVGAPLLFLNSEPALQQYMRGKVAMLWHEREEVRLAVSEERKRGLVFRVNPPEIIQREKEFGEARRTAKGGDAAPLSSFSTQEREHLAERVRVRDALARFGSHEYRVDLLFDQLRRAEELLAALAAAHVALVERENRRFERSLPLLREFEAMSRDRDRRHRARVRGRRLHKLFNQQERRQKRLAEAMERAAARRKAKIVERADGLGINAAMEPEQEQEQNEGIGQEEGPLQEEEAADNQTIRDSEQQQHQQQQQDGTVATSTRDQQTTTTIDGTVLSSSATPAVNADASSSDQQQQQQLQESNSFLTAPATTEHFTSQASAELPSDEQVPLGYSYPAAPLRNDLPAAFNLFLHSVHKPLDDWPLYASHEGSLQLLYEEDVTGEPDWSVPTRRTKTVRNTFLRARTAMLRQPNRTLAATMRDLFELQLATCQLIEEALREFVRQKRREDGSAWETIEAEALAYQQQKQQPQQQQRLLPEVSFPVFALRRDMASSAVESLCSYRPTSAGPRIYADLLLKPLQHISPTPADVDGSSSNKKQRPVETMQERKQRQAHAKAVAKRRKLAAKMHTIAAAAAAGAVGKKSVEAGDADVPVAGGEDIALVKSSDGAEAEAKANANDEENALDAEIIDPVTAPSPTSSTTPLLTLALNYMRVVRRELLDQALHPFGWGNVRGTGGIGARNKKKRAPAPLGPPPPLEASPQHLREVWLLEQELLLHQNFAPLNPRVRAWVDAVMERPLPPPPTAAEGDTGGDEDPLRHVRHLFSPAQVRIGEFLPLPRAMMLHIFPESFLARLEHSPTSAPVPPLHLAPVMARDLWQLQLDSSFLRLYPDAFAPYRRDPSSIPGLTPDAHAILRGQVSHSAEEDALRTRTHQLKQRVLPAGELIEVGSAPVFPSEPPEQWNNAHERRLYYAWNPRQWTHENRPKINQDDDAAAEEEQAHEENEQTKEEIAGAPTSAGSSNTANPAPKRKKALSARSMGWGEKPAVSLPSTPSSSSPSSSAATTRPPTLLEQELALHGLHLARLEQMHQLRLARLQRGLPHRAGFATPQGAEELQAALDKERAEFPLRVARHEPKWLARFDKARVEMARQTWEAQQIVLPALRAALDATFNDALAAITRNSNTNGGGASLPTLYTIVQCVLSVRECMVALVEMHRVALARRQPFVLPEVSELQRRLQQLVRPRSNVRAMVVPSAAVEAAAAAANSGNGTILPRVVLVLTELSADEMATVRAYLERLVTALHLPLAPAVRHFHPFLSHEEVKSMALSAASWPSSSAQLPAAAAASVHHVSHPANAVGPSSSSAAASVGVVGAEPLSSDEGDRWFMAQLGGLQVHAFTGAEQFGVGDVLAHQYGLPLPLLSTLVTSWPELSHEQIFLAADDAAANASSSSASSLSSTAQLVQQARITHCQLILKEQEPEH